MNTDELSESQATITRLEATITERDKEIAEAVGLLREIQQYGSLTGDDSVTDKLDAYLSAHEGKENDPT